MTRPEDEINDGDPQRLEPDETTRIPARWDEILVAFGRLVAVVVEILRSCS
jgi:hypothetical protein